MREIDLSIIILSYNTSELLIQCLTSIAAALTPNAKKLVVEVLVVDNASSDNSVSAVREYQKQTLPFALQLIVNRDNLGYAAGNNCGIKTARGKYLLFLNSDTIVYPNTLVTTLGIMQGNPNIGALTVKTLLPNGQMDPDCHRGFPTPWASISYFLGLEKLFSRQPFFGQYHQLYLDPDTDHEVDAGAGAFMLISRQVIDEVGVWDETYFFYGEDLDYFYRIKKAGFLVYYHARPQLTHYKGASSGLRKESRHISRNTKTNRIKVAKASVKAMEIFYRKFYAGNYPAIVTGIVLAGIRFKGWIRLAQNYLRD